MFLFYRKWLKSKSIHWDIEFGERFLFNMCGAGAEDGVWFAWLCVLCILMLEQGSIECDILKSGLYLHYAYFRNLSIPGEYMFECTSFMRLKYAKTTHQRRKAKKKERIEYPIFSSIIFIHRNFKFNWICILRLRYIQIGKPNDENVSGSRTAAN